MAILPLGVGAYERRYAREPRIVLQNRFFEENPTNMAAGTALLSRPGTTLFAEIGLGPIRANFTQEGTFNGALFSVSGKRLFRIDKNRTITPISGQILGEDTPSMGGTDQYLFIADGTQLQFYDGVGSRAQDDLVFSFVPLDGETVTINGTTYTYRTLMTAIYDVQIGSDVSACITNLVDAINATPETENVNYYVGTPENTDVIGFYLNDTTLRVYAKTGGTIGNSYTVSTTVTGGSWTTPTLEGGLADALTEIITPDDIGIVSIAVLNSFVFCAGANSDRIYFIRPGEITIDPLDFFTAEAIPDEIISLMTVGDQLWAFGAQSTQPFALNGDPETVVSPILGRAFSRGALKGTTVLLGSSVFVVGDDDVVYMVTGSPNRVSHSGIEEAIRRARKTLRGY